MTAMHISSYNKSLHLIEKKSLKIRELCDFYVFLY